MRKICIFNRKGGVGKSTIASILVNVFLEKDKEIKILVLDLDGQRNAGLYLQLDGISKIGIDTVYSEKIDARESIYKVNERLGYVHIVDERKFGREMQIPINPQRTFEKLINQYEVLVDDDGKPLYDIILVDLPPNKSIVNLCTLAYADDIMVPLELSEPSIKGLMDVSELLIHELEDEELSKIKLIIPNKQKVNTRSAEKNRKQLISLIHEMYPNLMKCVTAPIPLRENIKNFTEGTAELSDEVKEIFDLQIEQYLEQI